MYRQMHTKNHFFIRIPSNRYQFCIRVNHVLALIFNIQQIVTDIKHTL